MNKAEAHAQASRMATNYQEPVRVVGILLVDQLAEYVLVNCHCTSGEIKRVYGDDIAIVATVPPERSSA